MHTAQINTYICNRNNIRYERLDDWLLYAAVLLSGAQTAIANRDWAPDWLVSTLATLLTLLTATLVHWGFARRIVAYERATRDWRAFDQHVRMLCATADPASLVAQMPALLERSLQLSNATPISSAAVERRAFDTLSQWIPPREIMGLSTVRIDPPAAASPRRPSMPVWPPAPAPADNASASAVAV